MDTVLKFYTIKALPNLLYFYEIELMTQQLKWVGTLEMKLLRTL